MFVHTCNKRGVGGSLGAVVALWLGMKCSKVYIERYGKERNTRYTGAKVGLVCWRELAVGRTGAAFKWRRRHHRL